MTTNRNPLKGYGAGIKNQPLLGWIAWYTISEPRIEHANLKAKVIELGLDEVTLPAKLRSGDSFKRACRYAGQKKIPLVGTSNVANVLIRDVVQDTETVERHMIVEIRDSANHRLEYETAARLTLQKAAHHVSWEKDGVKHKETFFRRSEASAKLKALGDDVDASVESVNEPTLDIERTVWAATSQYRDLVDASVDKFVQEYDYAKTYLDPQTLRQMVRRQLDMMRSFMVRSTGSVYYIPVDQGEKAEKLAELLDWISDGSVFHMLPFIDTEKQREMMQASFEAVSMRTLVR